MEISHAGALLAALGYSLAALFSKRVLLAGGGILRLSFVTNLVFVLVFSMLLLPGIEPVPLDRIHLPLISGGLFFLGQVFTFAAIRVGDVSLQTPVMGTKVVFVVLIALVLGTEAIGAAKVAAALLAMLGVVLLGYSGGGALRVGPTLVLALLSSFFFAGADVLVGTYGRDFGPRNFLVIAMLANGLLSFLLVPFFHEPLRKVPGPAWKWMLLAALAMAGQALLLNLTLAIFQNVSVINVLYSSRGLWSILLAAPFGLLLKLPREVATRRILVLRISGTLLLSLAIAVILGWSA